MPYCGAVVDYTPHRRKFGTVAATLLTLANLAQAFLFPQTWFAMLLVQASVAPASFFAQSIAMWAYLNEPREADRDAVVSAARLWELVGGLLYILVVAGSSVAAGLDDLDTARVGQAVAAALGGALLAGSWAVFGERDARRSRPAGEALWLSGFTSLWTTARWMATDEPRLARLLGAICFIDSAAGATVSMTVVYLTQQIGVPGSEIALFIVVALVCSIPGAVLHREVLRCLGHRRNLCLVAAVYAVVLGLTILLLSGPEARPYALAFSVPIGFTTGWVYPAMNGFVAAMVPPGRETETWGWVTFSAVVLSWAPPLVFTVIKETLGDLRLGTTSLIFFLVVGGVLAASVDDRAIPVTAGALDQSRTTKSSTRSAPGVASTPANGVNSDEAVGDSGAA
mmetsp:Transcript_17657/g.55031  ORF Transcript_17657/g.55031 Transcript_17657/m.55031 type:complete len:397 (+) Transcript_17657:340-1530(+)